MLRKSAAILLVLLSFLANEAFALGLGRVSVESSLNQPLRVRIEVLQLGDTRLEDVTIQLASPEDFERFNIDRASFLNNIRFTTEASSQGNYVVLTTSQIVREPYLSFILETRWSNGRLLSEHTILLDLPIYEDDAVPEAPVRRPIGSTIDSQTLNTVESVPAVSPTSNAPSVQPVLEPESIAPESSTITTQTEQADSDVSSALENSDQEAADQAAAEPAVTNEEDTPAPELDSQADASLDTDESSPDAELDADTAGELTEELPDETVAEVDTSEPLAQEEDDTEEIIEDAIEDSAPEVMTVGASDTLSAIALQMRPNNSVSIQQTMLAIQELNPDAFAGGNINRLRQGEVLRIPSLSDIQAVGQREAIAEVGRQNSALGVQPLAAPTQAATTAEQSDGQLSVVTADPDAESADGSGVTEESDTAALDQRIAQLEDQLALKEEEADRARIEKEELESRLAELEEQIAAAQEIIRLRDLQLAQLQQSLADAAAEADRVAQAQAQAIEEETPAEQVPAIAEAQENESFVASLVRTITSNSMILIAGVVALILLLAGVLVWRNRSNRDDEERLDVIADDEFAGVTETSAVEEQELEQDQIKGEDSFGADSELHDYEESELDSELDAFMSVGSESADLLEESVFEGEQNLVEQVDILIEHEQLQQAETLLEEAIAADPDDHVLQMKRLEVLAAQGDASRFELHAGPLEIVSDSDERSKIDSLRAGLAAGDTNDQPLASTITEVDSQRQKDETASFLDDLGIDLDSFEDDAFQLSDDEPDATDSSVEEDESGAVSEVEEAEPEAVDLMFDLSSLDEGEATAESEEQDDVSIADIDVSEQEETPPDESAELPEKPVFSSNEESEEILAEGESALSQGESKNLDDLEIDSFEFDLDEQEADESPQAEKEEDLELETFSFEAPEIEAASEPEPAASNEELGDENALDFDFDKSEIEAGAEAEELAEVETFDFDLEGDSTDTVVEKSPSASVEAAPEASSESPALDASAGTADDFDFDLSDLEIDADEETAENIEIELSDDDFLDLDDELLSEDSAEDSLKEDADSAVEFDFDEEVTKSASADTVVESAMSDDDLDFLADEDVVFETPDHEGDPESLSDEEETATKLELAYAYQKMGDADGAREILQEVIAEGSETQIKEAKDLISSIDANPE